MVAGEASGDLLAGLLLGGLNARWPALVAAGIGGPQMAAQGFEAWWPHDKLAVRGYVEVLRPLPRDRRHPQRAGRAPAEATSPMPSSASTRPTSTSTSRSSCAPPASRRSTSSARRSGPGAASGSRRSAGRRPRAVPVPVRAGDLRQARRRGDLRRPSAGRRDPARAAARRERARALGSATTRPLVALLPGSRRSEIQYIAPRLFGAAARDRTGRGPALRFVLPVVPGCAH